jgi:hypothetical protein
MFKSNFSNKSSKLVRSYWNRWGWILSIVAVVIILFSMVRPESEKVKRGQLAVKLQIDRERDNLESKLGKQVSEIHPPRTVEK